MSGMIFQTIGFSLRSMAGLVLHTIGWAGVVTVLAGTVLLLTMSARLMKIFASPRGMAATAAVLLASIAFLWATWPQAATATPVAETPHAGPAEVAPAQPKPKPKLLDVVAATPEPPPKPPTVAAKRKRIVFPSLPYFTGPLAAALPSLPPIETFTPRMPVIVTPPAPQARQQAASHAHAPVVAKRNLSGTKAADAASRRPAIVASPLPGRAGPTGGVAAGQPDPVRAAHDQQAAIAAQQRAARQAHARQAQVAAMVQMNQMMEQFHGGPMGGHPANGMHPAAGHPGMHPMEGVHPGNHPMGGMHPAAGTGHPGVHH